jgi:flagellar protein FlaF
MYQFSYADVVEDSPREMRARERDALGKAIAMMAQGREKGHGSREMIEALFTMRRLWSIFLEDLQKPENELPPELRAALISIGIWVNKELDRLRSGQTSDPTALIEINEIIRNGLA